MKTRLSLSALALACATLAGCQNLPQGDLMQHGMMAVKAATLSDAEVRQVADQACAESDQQNRIAPANSKYGQRLDKIAKALGDQIDGVPVNYKVYLTEEVNAWAMANGCIRVYSGLMELMSDNEIEGVLGHEMGHVALGHTRKAAQTAYAAAAVRGAAGASKSGALAALSGSQLGELTESLVNAQFSQSQESDADDFSYELLKKRGVNTRAWSPPSRSWPSWAAATAACSIRTRAPRPAPITSASASLRIASNAPTPVSRARGRPPHAARLCSRMQVGPARSSTSRCTSPRSPSRKASSASTKSGPTINPLRSSTKAGLRPS